MQQGQECLHCQVGTLMSSLQGRRFVWCPDPQIEMEGYGIVWIWGLFYYSKIFIASPVKKMWPLQVRCLKRSGFKHRPPVWDVAMSMLWMKRLSPWRWTIFSNLAQKPNQPNHQGNHHGITGDREMVELVDQGFERRLLKGKWNLCFIISRNSVEKKR